MDTERPRPPPLALLFAMLFASQLASTIYLPGLPEIARDLATPAAATQMLVSIYLAGFASAQLVMGPLSDRFGRRPVTIGGLGLFAAASLACAAAPDIVTMYVARFAQAAGACATIVVSRAIIRDTSEGAATAQAMSYVAIAMGVGPVVAPFVGGILTSYIHWRATFLATGLAGVAALVWVVLILVETLPPARRDPLRAGRLIATYLRLAGNPVFTGYSMIIAFASGAMQAFLTAAPIVLITLMGVPAVLFGFYVMLMPAMFVVAAYLSRWLAAVMPIDRIILIGVTCSATGGVFQLALGLYGISTPIPLLIAFATSNFGTGLLFANCYGQALSAVSPSIAGSASALGGFLHMGWGFLVATVVAAVTHTSSLQLAIAQLATTSLSFTMATVLIFVIKPGRPD